jgi:16S rRNA (guanine966-N2)-methyltransferase
VREALFSMLANVVPGAAFLDLYAGSGAVGLEALSRGARTVTWVEKDARHVAVLKQNLAALAPEAPFKVTCMDVAHWVRGAGRGAGFDVAFADPPYEAGAPKSSAGLCPAAQETPPQGGDVFASLMAALAGNGVVAEKGFFVAEMAEACQAPEAAGWELLRDRTYGHTRLALYRRLEAAGGESGEGVSTQVDSSRRNSTQVDHFRPESTHSTQVDHVRPAST